MVSPTAASSSTAFSADTSAGAGFILVPVIWVVFFLAMAVAGFTLAIRANVQHTASAAASAEAAALADAGIHLALLDLTSGQADVAWRRRFPPDGKPYACAVGAGRVVVMVTDEAGKIDLNQAGERHFRALIRGLGVATIEASSLAAAIIDYRDSDSTPLPGGAEDAQYRQAGRAAGPKNAPFDSIYELAHVLGMDEALLRKALPHVTVHSALLGVDPTKASSGLMTILTAGSTHSPEDQEEDADQSVRRRLPSELSAVSTQRAFAITSQATGERGGTLAREAIVRLTRSGAQPYEILSWRQVGAVPGGAWVDLGAC